jgi:hypothetical protein
MASLNPHDWACRESVFAFNKARHVMDLLNHNFGSGPAVHVGIIYLAVGCNGGRATARYLLFIPYYDPGGHGYSFNMQHPFVFARGFPYTASLDFYAWMDIEWTKSIEALTDNSELLKCTPILCCRFDCVDSAEFVPVPWVASADGDETIVAKDATIACWIRGHVAPTSTTTRAPPRIKEERASEFRELVKSRNEDQLQALMEGLVTSSNSYSFPAVHMVITSPMTGLVPFVLMPVRLQIGGKIAAAEHGLNDVHISVTKTAFALRRISFQRLWSLLYDTTCTESGGETVRDMRERIRTSLDC